MKQSIVSRLEKYTIERQEVLMVSVETAEGEEDLIVIYQGFSSSLMRPTAFDPDVPAIAPDSKITAIDRLVAPYNPDNPQYIEEGLTLTAMEKILSSLSI